MRALWDAAVANEPDPALWLRAMGRAYFELEDERLRVATLWVQSLTEAAEDPEIRTFLREHMREVHGYVCGVIRRSQRAGGVVRDRDPSAEAWIFISVGLLTTISERLGGLVEDDMRKVIASRHQWLTGPY